MSQYRRSYQKNGCYFFTVVTHHRMPLFSDPDNVDLLRHAFKKVKTRYPFTLESIVILPDHLHCIWVLPDGDSDYSVRWRLIKTEVSKRIAASVNTRGEKLIWQRRFWEHTIRDENDWRRHMDYIFYNPVKHGLCKRPGDWPYSSFTHAVKKGWYKQSWGAEQPESIAGVNYE
ncbi:REP-associated tyrosine transposase [Oceanicoccus sagamiensis]|uniref:Transposase n=1 Tax=Oceanicoccus sagamiensis TaxID=716816 RepID=A0A1X9NBN6_9GAMM|nr:transposase [Oceanicoccus sagamiensis]ARN73852.1 transposase [Oceanicoccus sagamiensis]